MVFMVGMEENLFPHSQYLMEVAGLEEERRLCYVAITRAKEKLHLTNAKSRMYFGTVQANISSRFLAEIPQSLIAYTGFGGFGVSSKKVAPQYQQRYGSFKQDTEKFLDDMDFDRKNFSWD